METKTAPDFKYRKKKNTIGAVGRLEKDNYSDD